MLIAKGGECTKHTHVFSYYYNNYQIDNLKNYVKCFYTIGNECMFIKDLRLCLDLIKISRQSILVCCYRLAGAALLAPVVNYWWSGFPANLSKEAFEKQPSQDQWAQRVAHHLPWLTYWWNTQKLFPGSSVAAGKAILSQHDLELIPKIVSLGTQHRVNCFLWYSCLIYHVSTTFFSLQL